MLRPILATAIIAIPFAGGALGAFGAAYRETLTPTGRIFVLVSIVALIWIGLALMMAYAALYYLPPNNVWQTWWRAMAAFSRVGAICVMICVPFALAYKWLLLPVVGEPIGTLVYCGVIAICVHLFLNRLQRPH